MSSVDETADRRLIHDLVLRYCTAVDRGDYPGVRAVYASDGVDNHTGFSGPADEFVQWLRVRIAGFDGTMHLVGNHLVDLYGDHAFAETYGMAVHWGSPFDDETLNFTSGFRYLDHLRRDPEGWRIVERTAVRDWTRSDAGRMRSPEGDGPQGRRGPADPLEACRDRVRYIAGLTTTAQGETKAARAENEESTS
ncbi:nuclear transport factor 2 family protein [Microbacterium panaciterrae]|uniref:Nuclear transport factor 2 family protein n=1 Tax=Microbacterium panaciterrae TaxID=985759 RepID=A0ABP8PKJ8_9MICO